MQGHPVQIVFGFSPSKNDYGLMIYNKNRLIKAYEHVGCQKSSTVRTLNTVRVLYECTCVLT